MMSNFRYSQRKYGWPASYGYRKFAVANVTAVKIEGGRGLTSAAFILLRIFYDWRSRFRIASVI